MSSRPDPYVYPAVAVRVIDGDTMDVGLDLGFGIRRTTRVRLLGINCPEITGPSKTAGLAAKVFVESIVKPGDAMLIQSRALQPSQDAFGRALVFLWVGQAQNTLNQLLIEKGHAVPYLHELRPPA